jgi:hypothetical protein
MANNQPRLAAQRSTERPLHALSIGSPQADARAYGPS